VILVVAAAVPSVRSPLGVALLIALFGWMALSRIVRVEFLALRDREYVEAAAGELGWLYDTIRPPGFHLLLCGQHGAFNPRDVESVRRGSAVPLRAHRLSRDGGREELADPDGRLLRRLGIADAGSYLIRPDAYVAYRSRGVDLDGVGRFLAALTGNPNSRPATSRQPT
jgi:hypothetical protein